MSLLAAVKGAMKEEKRPVKVSVEKAHNGGYIAETSQGYGPGIKTTHKTHMDVANHIKAMCKWNTQDLPQYNLKLRAKATPRK